MGVSVLVAGPCARPDHSSAPASVSSQSDAYRDAVARQSGRTAFGREQHHPGIPRQFRKDEIPPSGRRQFYSGS
jgi:hypothetical protein